MIIYRHKHIILLAMLVFLATTQTGYAQQTMSQSDIWITPSVLLGLGLVTSIPSIKTDLQERFPRTNNDIDDYLQFAPIALMYSTYLWKAKHKNTFRVQSAYWGISQGISNLAVWATKWLVNSERPNKSNRSSMPSAHTANAFVNAGILYEEFKDFNPWLAYSGYVMATAVGGLRVTNNAHWLPDVLIGAAIGILATKLTYYFDFYRKKSDTEEEEEDNISYSPFLYPAPDNTQAIGISFNFNL